MKTKATIKTAATKVGSVARRVGSKIVEHRGPMICLGIAFLVIRWGVKNIFVLTEDEAFEAMKEHRGWVKVDQHAA